MKCFKKEYCQLPVELCGEKCDGFEPTHCSKCGANLFLDESIKSGTCYSCKSRSAQNGN